MPGSTLPNPPSNLAQSCPGLLRSNTSQRPDERQTLFAPGLAAPDIHATQSLSYICALSRHRVHKWPCPRGCSCDRSAISSSSILPLRLRGPGVALHTRLLSLAEASTLASGCPGPYPPRSEESQHRLQLPRLRMLSRISLYSLHTSRDAGGEGCRPTSNCCPSSNPAGSREKPEEIDCC